MVKKIIEKKKVKLKPIPIPKTAHGIGFEEAIQKDIAVQEAEKKELGGRWAERKEGMFQDSHEMNSYDWARIGAAAADLSGLIATAAAGPGNVLAGATGIGSTFADLYADSEDDLDWGDIGSFAVNLGLDVASFIPFAGTAAKMGKAGRVVTKIIPTLKKVLAYGALGAGATALSNAVNKIEEHGWRSLSSSDIADIMRGLQGLTAGTRAGKQFLASKLGTKKTNVKDFDLHLKNKKANLEAKLKQEGASAEDIEAKLKDFDKKGNIFKQAATATKKKLYNMAQSIDSSSGRKIDLENYDSSKPSIKMFDVNTWNKQGLKNWAVETNIRQMNRIPFSKQEGNILTKKFGGDPILGQKGRWLDRFSKGLGSINPNVSIRTDLAPIRKPMPPILNLNRPLTKSEMDFYTSADASRFKSTLPMTSNLNQPSKYYKPSILESKIPKKQDLKSVITKTKPSITPINKSKKLNPRKNIDKSARTKKSKKFALGGPTDKPISNYALKRSYGGGRNNVVTPTVTSQISQGTTFTRTPGQEELYKRYNITDPEVVDLRGFDSSSGGERKVRLADGRWLPWSQYSKQWEIKKATKRANEWENFLKSTAIPMTPIKKERFPNYWNPNTLKAERYVDPSNLISSNFNRYSKYNLGDVISTKSPLLQIISPSEAASTWNDAMYNVQTQRYHQTKDIAPIIGYDQSGTMSIHNYKGKQLRYDELYKILEREKLVGSGKGSNGGSNAANIRINARVNELERARIEALKNYQEKQKRQLALKKRQAALQKDRDLFDKNFNLKTSSDLMPKLERPGIFELIKPNDAAQLALTLAASKRDKVQLEDVPVPTLQKYTVRGLPQSSFDAAERTKGEIRSLKLDTSDPNARRDFLLRKSAQMRDVDTNLQQRQEQTLAASKAQAKQIEAQNIATMNAYERQKVAESNRTKLLEAQEKAKSKSIVLEGIGGISSAIQNRWDQRLEDDKTAQTLLAKQNINRRLRDLDQEYYRIAYSNDPNKEYKLAKIRDAKNYYNDQSYKVDESILSRNPIYKDSGLNFNKVNNVITKLVKKKPEKPKGTNLKLKEKPKKTQAQINFELRGGNKPWE